MLCCNQVVLFYSAGEPQSEALVRTIDAVAMVAPFRPAPLRSVPGPRGGAGDMQWQQTECHPHRTTCNLQRDAARCTNGSVLLQRLRSEGATWVNFYKVAFDATMEVACWSCITF